MMPGTRAHVETTDLLELALVHTQLLQGLRRVRAAARMNVGLVNDPHIVLPISGWAASIDIAGNI
jgi:hypothetical protein